MVVVVSSSSHLSLLFAASLPPGTFPVHSGSASAPPGAFSRGLLDRHPPGALRVHPGALPAHFQDFSTRHHPGALWVGLGTLPAHYEVFDTRHHPGALRVCPSTIPVHLRGLKPAALPAPTSSLCWRHPGAREVLHEGVESNLTS